MSLLACALKFMVNSSRDEKALRAGLPNGWPLSRRPHTT